jgi:hypothetical protein
MSSADATLMTSVSGSVTRVALRWSRDMKAKDAGRVNKGIRSATPRAARKPNKDSLRGSPGPGCPAFDPEDYHVGVGNDVPRMPRLKWEKHRREGENPAQFAWRAYAVEAAADTLHRGLIHREDPELHSG